MRARRRHAIPAAAPRGWAWLVALLTLLAIPGEAWAEGWSRGPSMVTGRTSFPAVVLPDGRVLAAGGRSERGGPLAEAEAYDPQTSRWSPVGQLGHARALHAGTVLGDGRVLVSGGLRRTSSGGLLPLPESPNAYGTAEVFDPALNAWGATAAMPEPRYNHASVRLGDGRVIVAGGSNDEDFVRRSALYDPRTNRWVPGPDLGEARELPAATPLPDGGALVSGGFADVAPIRAERYDPRAEAWRPTGEMSSSRWLHRQTLLEDGRVLVTGGVVFRDGRNVALETAEVYDPATNRWSPVPPMRRPRADHAAVRLLDGRVLVAGGASGTGGSATMHQDSEVYDPVAGVWSDAGNMPAPRSDIEAVLLDGGGVLVPGGTAEELGRITARVELFTATARALRLTVAPRRIRAGTRRGVRARVTTIGPRGQPQPVPGARVRIGRRWAETDAGGLARLTARAPRRGPRWLRATAERPGYRSVARRIAVRRPGR